MVREGIFSDSKFLKIAELPDPIILLGYILVRGIKADRCLEWLDRASPPNPNLKKLLLLGPITLIS